jgi:hypothetical protein
LIALSLLIPAGVMAASSAGAAATLPTCTKLTGSVKYSIALPIIGNSTKVNSTTTTKLSISGCTGGGITSGTISGTAKYVGNCTTLVVTPSKTPLVNTVKWSNGSTSTLSTTTKITSKTGVQPVLATLSSKVTKGLGVGHTTSVNVKAVSKTGSCLKIPLTGYTLTNTGKFTTK